MVAAIGMGMRAQLMPSSEPPVISCGSVMSQPLGMFVPAVLHFPRGRIEAPTEQAGRWAASRPAPIPSFALNRSGRFVTVFFDSEVGRR